MPDPQVQQEVRRRRTFAIISHPDAGKTTLTEKLLLYGGAIHIAGAVKSRKAARAAASDWMSIEKERGISVSTSVMQFPYRGHAVNILDTPGHQDFSEDTYRTLSAVDSAVMLIDVAKGVEAQTKKLFQVCRLRDMPIFTWVNKLDREGREPLDLMSEIENLLGIHCSPVNWPVGMGRDFKGVLDLKTRQILLFSGGEKGSQMVETKTISIDDPKAVELIGEKLLAQTRDEVDLLAAAGNELDLDKVRSGKVTPVFFGSALTNFGVEPFLDAFLDMAPTPVGRVADVGPISPEDDRFSGFVFKIQANMDPNHRDRIAFLRIVSGKFVKGMNVTHVREEREVRLNKSLMFLAQERSNVEEAFPGDVVGLYDTGLFRIGDTICTGKPIRFQGIPRFSPEHFASVRVKDPLKRKALEKGMNQLSEEGAIQVFERWGQGMKDPILGAVGALQFEVFAHRLRGEYGAEVILEKMPFTMARWVEGDGFRPVNFEGQTSCMLTEDRDGLPVVLFKGDWALEFAIRENPGVTFADNAPDRTIRQAAGEGTKATI